MGDQLTNETKKEILRTFFDREINDGALDEYSEYFGFFRKQLLQISISDDNLQANLCTRIQDAVKYMQQLPNTTLPALVNKLKPDPRTPNDEKDFRTLVDCALRVWLSVDSRRPAWNGNVIEDSGRTFCWDEESPLCDFVHGLFFPQKKFGDAATEPTPNDTQEAAAETASIQGRLTHPLTAVNLERYPNIGIRWTPYLWNHLRFSDRYKKLQVFGQGPWLRDATAFLEKRGKHRLLDTGEWDETGPYKDATQPSQREIPPLPLPATVLTEALLSLTYLFPPSDDETDAFLRRPPNRQRLPPMQPSDRPKLKQFEHYHDALVVVAQEFLNPPRDWRTMWSDNRNPVQFLTFWFGLLVVGMTFVFGVLATVLAGVQYHVARYPPPTGGDGNAGR